MEGKEPPGQRTPLFQGDKVLRVRRRSPGRRSRINPYIPRIFRFLKQIVSKTLFISLLIALNGGHTGKLKVEHDTAWSKNLSTDELEAFGDTTMPIMGARKGDLKKIPGR